MVLVSDFIFSFGTPFAGLPLSLAAEQLTCEAKAAPDQEKQTPEAGAAAAFACRAVLVGAYLEHGSIRRGG